MFKLIVYREANCAQKKGEQKALERPVTTYMLSCVALCLLPLLKEEAPAAQPRLWSASDVLTWIAKCKNCGNKCQLPSYEGKNHTSWSSNYMHLFW